MMGFDLADDYVRVAEAFGYELEDMEALSLAGVEASWAPADEKRVLRERFMSEFDQLRAAHGLAARTG